MKRYVFVGAVLVAAISYAVWLFFNGMTPKTLITTVESVQITEKTASTTPLQLKNTSATLSTGPTLTFGSTTISVDIADTEAKQVQGLSGRTGLAENSGMLFVFETSAQWGIWMKDMNFPLDIIWLDKEFKIISVKENATPDSSPEVFKPSRPALYVLEVPAYYISSHNIKIGERATFSQK